MNAFCGTWHLHSETNPLGYRHVSLAHHKLMDLVPVLHITFMEASHEMGKNGDTDHIHIYIETRDKMRVARVKSVFGHGMHWEPLYAADAQKYIDYIEKDGDVFIKTGTRRHGKGHRSDLDRVAELISSKATLQQLWEAVPGALLRYPRGIDQARALNATARNTKPICIYIYGDSGTGKTRSCYDLAAKHSKTIFMMADDRSHWLDGYMQQDILVLDEFTGEQKNVYYNTLFDRYPCSMQVKGGFTQINSPVMIVCSNYSIDDIRSMKNWNDAQTAQFRRRFDKVIHLQRFGNDNTNYVYAFDTYDPFVNKDTPIDVSITDLGDEDTVQGETQPDYVGPGAGAGAGHM